MSYFQWLFFLLLNCGVTFGYHHDKLTRQLQSRYFQAIKQKDPLIARKFSSAFEIFRRTSQENTMAYLLQDDGIVQSFFIKNIPEGCQDDVQKSQILMLSQLYMCLYKKYIKSAKSMLDELVVSKTYWSYEKFYMQQRSFSRAPTYLCYFSGYEHTIDQKLQQLDKIEEHIAQVLGICLYGMKVLSHAENEEQLSVALGKAMRPLYEQYHIPAVQEIEHEQIAPLFMQMRAIHHDLSQQLHELSKVLSNNQKPMFVVRHWLLSACVAATATVAGYVALKYPEQIAQMKAQSRVATSQFIDEYIIDPINGLVDVVWHGQKAEIPEIPDPVLLEEFDFSGVHVDVENEITLWGYRIPIKTKASCVGLDKEGNKLVRAVNANVVKGVAVAKDSRAMLKDNIANQQINMHLMVIGPVLVAGYLASKGVKALYNRYVKHDNWYLPMKYLLRSISRLLNDQSCAGRSFVVDGKLYMLASHMQDYTACLQDEELIMMQQDIQDLLSFDLNYYQKQQVVERMYRSYQFLR